MIPVLVHRALYTSPYLHEKSSQMPENSKHTFPHRVASSPLSRKATKTLGPKACITYLFESRTFCVWIEMCKLVGVEVLHQKFFNTSFPFTLISSFAFITILRYRAMRGAFIVLEGLDRSGKSTQADVLCEALKARGRKVSLWKYPSRETFLGKYA